MVICPEKLIILSDEFQVILAENKLLEIKEKNKVLLEIFNSIFSNFKWKYNTINSLCLLCDKDGYIIEICRKGLNICCWRNILVPGLLLKNISCGINAIFLAKKQKKVVKVTEDEHVCPYLKHITSYAIPIAHNKEIIGYLGMFVKNKGNDDFCIPFLESTVKLIESRLKIVEIKDSFSLNKRIQHVLGDILTPREAEVLKLLANGLNTKEVSMELQISRETVKGYVKSIYDKIGVKTKRECINKVLKLIHKVTRDFP